MYLAEVAVALTADTAYTAASAKFFHPRNSHKISQPLSARLCLVYLFISCLYCRKSDGFFV